jgi:hypothetical protein
MKKKSKFLNNNVEFLVMLAIGIVAVIPLLYGFISYASSSDTLDSQSFLEKPDAQYKKCVKDVEYMRLNHMELLKDIREDSVRFGKRGEIELNGCKKCHTSRARFCDKCHILVSAKLDCFDCHYYQE